MFFPSRLLLPLGLALSALPTGICAQVDRASDQKTEQETGRKDSDIVVIGKIEPLELPTQVEPGSPVRRIGGQTARDSDRMIRCAGLPDPAELSKILDNGPRHPAAKKALHRYIVSHRGCYMGYPTTPMPSSPFFGDCNPVPTDLLPEPKYAICRSTLDRGQLYERAVDKYTDVGSLIRSDTMDKAVQYRFWARAEDRKRFRYPDDYRFFAVVACMISQFPQLGAAMLDSELGSDEERLAMQRLIGGGSICVGGAKNVKVDAASFRAYTAEVMYELSLARRGGNSLIPAAED